MVLVVIGCVGVVVWVLLLAQLSVVLGVVGDFVFGVSVYVESSVVGVVGQLGSFVGAVGCPALCMTHSE